MAIAPVTTTSATGAPALRRFDCRNAALVASWVGDAREAEWLAPRTAPPITAEKILNWQEAGRQPFELVREDVAVVGYGELNILRSRPHEYWLGHLLIDPEQRGRGLGTALVRLLLERAFNWHAARRVVLVVFTDNKPAIAAYRAAGMRDDGYESHYFAPYQRDVRLLRMDARNA